ncbi:MAG: iron-containing alcohol dehydrogenase [Anaerosporomusa subterranea]|jgi:alcohol dehydrogenase class IV|nr:iron-containing alcohol dehydrogenase [Anaerosporomusa subterranea]
MQFRFFMPTKLYFGSNCIQENKEEFLQWGKKALVVTGRNSARLSGALADLTRTLEQAKIDYELFEQIEENPTIEAVEAAGLVARRFKPDMIIAIGGGSPLDAAKAIAVLAVNDMPARKLFDGGFAVQPLPILAVPLTAGTGSEVTPYSILTDVERQTKRSFSDPSIFPKVAFLDARYTQTLSRSVTVNSAVDALSHAIEGYLSRRSTPVTDCMALEAIRSFGAVKQALLNGIFTLPDREALLQMSLVAGIVLAQTATTVVHALGYSLTYFSGIPHGRANGLLLAEYLRFNAPVIPEKVNSVLEALGLGSIDEFGELLNKLLTGDEVFTAEDFERFAVLANKAPNTAFTARQPNLDELKQILMASLPVTSHKQ